MQLFSVYTRQHIKGSRQAGKPRIALDILGFIGESSFAVKHEDRRVGPDGGLGAGVALD